ncbi:class I SAM-dependent methyltransferase [Vagococcus intermedius]|uniref:Class I SAM-dependent methyltransferase n=1 Tax=Vagococcus intermedius TaxID=2991418 RepID=A0AAF0I760_9ENTE|nr:class I SAM-dependent methyltransferase [Vagococcus intermedius]WEG73125.1 class I SAM-dependent methyltransferase [Vagococcus intermedius]WEG75209.1 class I SAM-dependent methyltransferase [Vagococcus intermedius]
MQKSVFDTLANRYDTPERQTLAGIISSHLKPHLVGTPVGKLLDYGAGTGLVSLPLANLTNFLLLVDASQEMLTLADHKIKQLGLGQTQTLVADFTKTSPNVHADVILVSLVLLHIPETENILQAFYDCLNPGGRLMIVDFDNNPNVSHPLIHSGFNQEVLQQQLKNVGFQQINSATFHQGTALFMKQDASLFLATAYK